jgi:hypothetical protein
MNKIVGAFFSMGGWGDCVWENFLVLCLIIANYGK